MRFITKSKRFELAAILVVKLLLLLVIWQLFFSHPKDRALDACLLRQHYLGAHYQEHL